MTSIVSKNNYCFLCGATNGLQEHHMIFGSKRKLADEDGLTVKLCYRCHQNIHSNPNWKDKQEALKRLAEECWIEHYGSEEEFIKRYGRTYL